MPREAFERELRRLQDDLLVMADMVESAIAQSVECLRVRDLEGSRRIIANDHLINEKRAALETDCMVVVATQQPMAGDLRTLAAVLHIIDELERMGDYAKGISRINLVIGDRPLIKPLVDVPLMSERVCSMLSRSLDAFVRRDVEAARALPREDDMVDSLYEQVYRELLTYVMANPVNIEQANYLLWVAHNLERAADRVTNLCERVIFTVTGELVELDNERPTTKL